MKSFNEYLKGELADKDFAQIYQEELRLARLAVQIAKRRERQGMTQSQLASKAHLTQQQVSKVEHAGSDGFNVNTLFRVCDALGLELTLQPRKDKVIQSKGGASGKKNGGGSKRIKHKSGLSSVRIKKITAKKS